MADDFFEYIRRKRVNPDINSPVPLPRDPTKRKPIVTSVSTPNWSPTGNLTRKKKRESVNGVI